MIKIKAIDPPDRTYRDPFILLSDGKIEMWVFADEFHHKVGDEYSHSIFPLSSESVNLNINKVYEARPVDVFFGTYNLFGKITSDWNLSLGKFLIDMPEDALSDFKIGDFVQANVDRLDVDEFENWP